MLSIRSSVLFLGKSRNTEETSPAPIQSLESTHIFILIFACHPQASCTWPSPSQGLGLIMAADVTFFQDKRQSQMQVFLKHFLSTQFRGAENHPVDLFYHSPCKKHRPLTAATVLPTSQFAGSCVFLPSLLSPCQSSQGQVACASVVIYCVP